MRKRDFWRQLSLIKRFYVPSVMSLAHRETKSQRPFRVSVEGNIGSGKSTVLNYFKRFPFVEIYDEPLEKWRDVQGHNLLQLLYDDMDKWTATFQSYVQLTRVQMQTSSPRDGITIQMYERSVQNNRYCFLENALLSGTILPAQYSVLCEWFHWINENVDISLDLIVYLRTSPEVAYKRMLNRGRFEERQINLEYIKLLHKAHEKWLVSSTFPKPTVLVVDADKDYNDVIESCQKQLPALFKENHTLNKTLVQGT